jgi:hypothetical protein
MSKRTREEKPEAAEVVEEAAPVPTFTVVPFGTGYKQDAHDPRDWNASARFGAVKKAALPAEALGLREFIRRIHDQTITSSCVGQALSQAIDTRLRKLGFDFEPSSMAPYTGARALDHGVLVDAGCYPRDAMRFVATNGVPREHVWPFDPAKVNEPLPWDVLQDASRFLLFAWWRIYSSGQQRSDAVAQAVAAGFPVIFGLDIDNAFFGYSGGTIMRMNADSAGGHMLCIVGYRTREDGTREFLVANSWGYGWGENGMCWMHEDVLETSRASDFYVIEVSP